MLPPFQTCTQLTQLLMLGPPNSCNGSNHACRYETIHRYTQKAPSTRPTHLLADPAALLLGPPAASSSRACTPEKNLSDNYRFLLNSYREVRKTKDCPFTSNGPWSTTGVMPAAASQIQPNGTLW